jgi:hypothetical protein
MRRLGVRLIAVHPALKVADRAPHTVSAELGW